MKKFTKEELKKLRADLPHDAIERISKHLNYSESYVKTILYGQADNERIIIYASEIRRAYLAQIEEIKEELNN